MAEVKWEVVVEVKLKVEREVKKSGGAGKWQCGEAEVK